MPELRVTVHGHPAPQGSKRHVGRGIMVESSKALKPWREAVKWAALQAVPRLLGVADSPLTGPVVVDMIFTFRRPASHYRTGRNAHLLRDKAPPRPAVAPDLSKLARATADALTDAGVWIDDARVVEYGRLAKVWLGEDPDALDTPGALIRVRELA
jgi:Holliday junction resolvase RusA-like endonuclease